VRVLLLLALAGLLLGAGLVALIEQDPGYVFVSVGGIAIETSVWLAVLLLLLAMAGISGMWRLLLGIFRSRRALSAWLGGRKHRNAAALTNRGLISFIEGNWARARKQLLRAARYSEAPLINHLWAANASFRLGDLEEMRKQLGIAAEVESGAGIALELTQAELQLSAGHYEQALATLVRARRNASKHPYVLELLTRAYTELGDWQALRELLPELRRHGLTSTSELAQLEATVWRGVLSDLTHSSELTEAALDKLWQSIPLQQRETAPLLECYLNALVCLGAHAKVQRQLVASLDKQWRPTLLPLFGQFVPADPKKLYKVVGRWLDQHGPEPGLLLAAGRVALHAEQWSKAQQWLQDAHSVEPTVAVCMLLAQLREAQGDVGPAADYRREALDLALPPMVKTPLPSTSSTSSTSST